MPTIEKRKIIVVYNRDKCKYDHQENCPQKGQVVLGKVHRLSNGIYLRVEGFERTLNDIKQLFPIEHFTEATCGQELTFKLQRRATKNSY